MPDDPYLSVLRQRIQRARVSKKLRQEDVAEKLGISVRSYQRYESGSPEKNFNPYVKTLRRIAHTLGVDVAAIVAEPTERELVSVTGKLRQRRVRRRQG